MVPISKENYIALYLQQYTEYTKDQLTNLIDEKIRLKRDGLQCSCGNKIWVVGSAVSNRNICFKCLIGHDNSSEDYEIDTEFD